MARACGTIEDRANRCADLDSVGPKGTRSTLNQGSADEQNETDPGSQ